MRATVRRKMEMADRALDFLRAHPSSDPSHLTVVQGLEARLARITALAVVELAGRRDARSATGYRRALRREAQATLVRLVERVGEMAAVDHPELVGQFEGPHRGASNAAFLARAWELLQRARTREEVLVPYGLAGAQLDGLAGLLTRFEEATERAHAGRANHVGARAELGAISAELSLVIGVLDALNQTRVREDPNLLAAWDSARSLAWPRPPVEAGKPVAPVVPEGAVGEPGVGRAA